MFRFVSFLIVILFLTGPSAYGYSEIEFSYKENQEKDSGLTYLNLYNQLEFLGLTTEASYKQVSAGNNFSELRGNLFRDLNEWSEVFMGGAVINDDSLSIDSSEYYAGAGFTIFRNSYLSQKLSGAILFRDGISNTSWRSKTDLKFWKVSLNGILKYIPGINELDIESGVSFEVKEGLQVGYKYLYGTNDSGKRWFHNTYLSYRF